MNLLHRFSLVLAVCALSCLLTCTDAGLYQWQKDPFQANKLTVSGTVCTDDPHQRNFPIKILFIIDDSSQLYSDPVEGPAGNRGRAIRQITDRWGKAANYQFGIIAYGSKARNLIETGFTRDSSQIESAISLVQGNGGISSPCIGDRCRDLRAAMSMASSVVTGDILAGDPGEIARTTYVLVLFSGGPPVPAIERCACRGSDETSWGACTWTDCEECQVTCASRQVGTATIQDQCDVNVCHPVCGPGDNNGCPDDQFCDSDYTCKVLPDTGNPNPTVPPFSTRPSKGIPDTFSQHWQWTIPTPPPQSKSECPAIPTPDAASLCYSAPQTGNNNSCEERTLVSQVRELKAFALKNGAAQLQLHTTYLPDQQARTRTDPVNDPWYPPCGAEANEARAVRLLSEMAYAADGNFLKFASSGGIDFMSLDLHVTRDPLVIKELVVTNTNVLTDGQGSHADTDADGLSDDQELQLKTCPLDEDTDGDGVSDAVELKLAFDSLVWTDPVECIDLTSSEETGDDPCTPGTTKRRRLYNDKDGDGLNACEERLLGTSDSVMDSDKDGIPDKVELVAATNYLTNDTLDDPDLDGMDNRDEIRGHTDARSSDSQTALDLSYRYEEVDEGLIDVFGFTQPTQITGVTIKNVSSSSGTGPGYLKFIAGTPPQLAWKDASDNNSGGDFGDPVDISKPTNEGYKLYSCRKSSAASGGARCAADSNQRYITVMVDGPDFYPPVDMTDIIVISSSKRNCLRFRVRNVTLLETGRSRTHNTTGNNTVKVYFAEAPGEAKDGFGIFKVREIQLNYHQGPPETRTPNDAEITIADDDFTVKE